MAGVTLTVDEARWRRHLQTVAAATCGLVPVIKGNGYGFGLERLADQARWLGVDAVAVGLAAEVAPVRRRFEGDVVVLYPYDVPAEAARALAEDPQVITTVARLPDLRSLAQAPGKPRVLIEVRTSVHRHGIALDDLSSVPRSLDGVRFEGWTIHLPLRIGGRGQEARRLARAALAAAPGPLWLSHLPVDETRRLLTELDLPTERGGDTDLGPVRTRVGTALWLGDPGGRRTTATVLDVHRVRRGERVGYRGRASPAAGWVLVIAGGTSQGVGLEAPTPANSLRQRATALATGSLAAAGRSLSPYTVAGRKRWFVEPPHMQSSLVFLPAGAPPPAVGEDVPVELRLTTATPDEVVLG